MEGVVRWEDPPADGRGRGSRDTKWDRIANTLATQPGRWALVLECKAEGAAHYFRQYLPDLEVTTRRVQNNPIRVDIYARYPVPEET